MSGPDHVQVLMAAFNAALYLRDQLDSLFAQTHQDWELLVRDNCSTDDTVAIVEEYARRYPGRIRLIRSDTNVGACQNFARLLDLADADLVMFSDADNVWHADKMALALRAMRKLEARYPAGTPLLVHTDLCVVDRDLHEIAPSFWRYSKLDVRGGRSFKRLLVQNVVTGSTVMINRPLAELARPIPPEAIMHDWWLPLVASALGHIGTLAAQTVDYRQHGANDTGASPFKPLSVGFAAVTPGGAKAAHARVALTLRQALAFSNQYDERLAPSERQIVQALAALSQQSAVCRRATLARHGFRKSGLLRTVGLFVYV